MRTWLLVVHLPAVVLWVGSLLVVTVVLAVHCREAAGEARAVLARVENKIFKGLTHPGAALVVISGVLLILNNPGFYLQAHWLHAKLLLVVFLIALDLRIYFRAKSLQAGKIETLRSEWVGLQAMAAVVFLGVIVLVLRRPL